jgi:hypothetical protein
VSEFETEPVPGLPEELPQGEVLLWQGTPRWTALARSALHVTAASLYVLAFAAWSFISELQQGQAALQAMQPALRICVAGGAGVALLAIVAWLIARSTIYTITSKRLVMRFGVALPLAINIPYRQIVSADARLNTDGSGDIAIRTTGETRLGFVPLWPHVRAWRLKNPEPVLRALPDARRAAQLLAKALAAEHGTVPKPVVSPSVPEAGGELTAGGTAAAA